MVMLDAVRYVVDNGVKWANLPVDFPRYRRVHAFARRWQVTGLIAELHDRLRDRVREKEGRSPDPSAAIKVSGRKRHVVVDCLGMVLAVAVTAASVQDRDTAVPLLEQLRKLHFSVRLVWADGGYAGRLVAWVAEDLQLSWLMRSRRLVRDYETLPAMHEAMVLWSMTMVMSGRLAGRRPGAFSCPRPRAR
ncbi:transposase [Streptomyces graminofaciens]|nr:transposase [Streptomyces graminofaciens]